MSKLFAGLTRSELMSRIRSRGNKGTELALAKLFRREKITGWRRQIQVRIGECEMRNRARRTRANSFRTPRSALRIFTVRPDFIFPKLRLAIFVDGCFWHGCPRHGTQPKGNRSFWKKKFARNIARDRLVNRTLRSANWRVLRLWEHELAGKSRAKVLRRIHRACSMKIRLRA